MTRAQAFRLKGLAEEAYHPEQSRRIWVLTPPRAASIRWSGDRAGGLLLALKQRGGRLGSHRKYPDGGAESSTMRPMEAGPTLARFLRLTL